MSDGRFSRRQVGSGLLAGLALVGAGGLASRVEAWEKRSKAMITVRKASERGHANHGWLNTHHTFSFANYYDPAHMGFRALRVINDDRVAPGTGFGQHGHRDMEIVTWVLSGAIEHRDSMGTVGTLRAGEMQRMTAGTGVLHSEMNGADEELHFLQIWILPNRQGLKPDYEQKAFPAAERQGRFRLVVSPDGEEGALRVNQDVRLYATLLGKGEKASYTLPAGRYAWLQMARGSATLNGVALEAGDGASLQAEGDTLLELLGGEDAEALLFDLA